MKKHIIFLLLLLLFSWMRENNNAEKVEFNSSRQLLESFFKLKYTFMVSQNRDSTDYYKIGLQESWTRIMEDKENILKLLISLEDDTTKNLYGSFYPENEHTIQKLPNCYHALYLMECIIRNDYLFNRRNHVYIGKIVILQNDGLNFILAKTDRAKYMGGYNYFIPIQLNQYMSFYKAGWKLYKEWYFNQYLSNKQLGVSPLADSPYTWFSLNEPKITLEQWAKTDCFNYGYFRIGHGW